MVVIVVVVVNVVMKGRDNEESGMGLKVAKTGEVDGQSTNSPRTSPNQSTKPKSSGQASLENGRSEDQDQQIFICVQSRCHQLLSRRITAHTLVQERHETIGSHEGTERGTVDRKWKRK